MTADETSDHRQIRRRTIGAGDARAVVIRRRYDSPILDVWAALTVPDRLNRWFLTVTGNLWVGGTFSFEGIVHGEILQCDPPRFLKLTWISGDRPIDEVEVQLAEDLHGGTVLEAEHAMVPELVEWEGKMVDPLPDVGSNWELCLGYLGKYLRGELPDTPSTDWYGPNPEDTALVNEYLEKWTALAQDHTRGD